MGLLDALLFGYRNIQGNGTAFNIRDTFNFTGDATVSDDPVNRRTNVAINGFAGVVLSGTPSTGQVPTATGPATATWQTPSGGGGFTAAGDLGGNGTSQTVLKATGVGGTFALAATAAILQWAAAATSPTLTQAALAGTGANAGQTMSVLAQAGQAQTGGAANNNGGNLVLGSGAAGTGGSGAAGVVGALSLKVGATQVGLLQQSSGDFLHLGAAGVGVALSPSALTWDSATSGVSIFQSQLGGTGATNGVDLFIQPQQGQNQTGATANNNGGNLLLHSGAAGTGGSGAAGAAGAIKFYAGATQSGELRLAATDFLNLGASNSIAQIAQNNIRFYVGANNPNTVYLKISDGGIGWCQFDINNQLIINSLGAGWSIGASSAWSVNSGINATNQLSLSMALSGLALGGLSQALGSATNTFLLIDGTAPTAAPTTGSAIYSTSGSLGVYASGFIFNTAVATPKIGQADNTTNSATATALKIAAQNATGTTAIGGDTIVTPGTGTTRNGSLNLQGSQVVSSGSFTPVNGSQTLSVANSALTTLNCLAGATGGVTITSLMPATAGRIVFIRNNTTQTISFAWASGSAATIATNTSALIGCDGTNAVKLMAGT